MRPRPRGAKSWKLPWHRHGFAYLTLVVAGSYREQLRGSSGVVGVGQAVVHPRGEQHHDLFAAAGAELLNLELTDEALGRLGAATAAFDRRRELPAGAAGPLVARLLAELRAPDELTPLVLEGACSTSPRASSGRERQLPPAGSPPGCDRSTGCSPTASASRGRSLRWRRISKCTPTI